MTKFNPVRRAALALISVLAMGVAALPAQAQDIKERNLRFAFSLAKDHPLGMGAQKFADAVSARSGGKMKVTLFPNAVLGAIRRTWRQCAAARWTSRRWPRA